MELFGPVVTDESDPLFMGRGAHWPRQRWTRTLLKTTQGSSGQNFAQAEALLWLKGTERSLSPVLFCLDSEYAANAIQGTTGTGSQVHQSALLLIERGKQLYLEEARRRRRAGGFSSDSLGISFTHVPGHCKIPGNERADSDELAARGKANFNLVS